MPASRGHATTTTGPRSRARLYATGALAAVVLLGAAAAVTWLRPEPVTCAQGRAELHVVASPDIAPVVSAVSRQVAGEPACVRVDVQAQEPAAVVESLARGEIRPPDVWVPDSALWLERADADRVAAATDAPSIASSPLVLAMTAAASGRIGAAGPRTEVSDVVEASNAGRPVALHLSDQNLSPARVGAILALQAAVADRADARGALAGVLQAAQIDNAPMATQLAALTAATDVAVPTPEQAVWAHNSPDGPPAVVAVYPGGSGAVFDYPYAVLSGDPDTAAAADRLLGALRGDAGQARLRAAGFRDATGRADASLTPTRGVDPAHPSGSGGLDAEALASAERSLASVKQDARLLAVMDVSGSMGLPAEGASGATRLSLAVDAAARGLALYPDSTEVGLWVFSKDLAGTTDYRELVPISPLAGAGAAGGRDQLAQALAGVAPVPDGDTGLYDTALAAVRAVQQGWNPSRVNAVVLLSDGKNTDTTGLTLDQLLASLAAERDPQRPVPVITIAYGPDSDAAALAQISTATAGATYASTDPTRIRQVFLDAIGQRACRPACAASPLA